jgi:hypothetical protein
MVTTRQAVHVEQDSTRRSPSAAPDSPKKTVAEAQHSAGGDKLAQSAQRTTRGNGPARAASLQRMQQTQGNRALQRRQPTVRPAVQRVPGPQNSFHRIAGDITSAFEGGRPGTLQTADSGIVSYGKHQATLASGALGRVLERYRQLSQSATANSLGAYMDRVQKHDPALRTDRGFLALLRTAASETAMDQAQDDVFSARYWAPARQSATTQHVESALGHAIFYDTSIQGGHAGILARTRQRMGGGIGDRVNGQPITEQAFLRVYIEEREARLLRLSAAAEKKGKHRDAEFLRASTYRTRELRALVDAGNLDLHGGADGNLKVHGRTVHGLTAGATVDDSATGMPGGHTAAPPTGTSTATPPLTSVPTGGTTATPAPTTTGTTTTTTAGGQQPAAQPPAATTVPADIAALNLLSKAEHAAMVLKQEDPHVVFTSGRRNMADQARAMAQNIVGGGGRHWIRVTYAAGPAQQLQAWVDQHPEARTQAQVQAGLLGVMQAMSPAELAGVSKHLSGESFDVQPGSTRVELIQALPGLTQFLTKEGKLTRWHITVRE